MVGSLCIILTTMIFSAGCTTNIIQSNSTPANTLAVTTTIPLIIPHHAGETIPQPNTSHAEFLKTGSDVYDRGEIIEFYVLNEGSNYIQCWKPPSYQIYQQENNGTWKWKVTPFATLVSLGYDLNPGESTPVQKIITDDKDPGLYKIVSDCGVSRLIEITKRGGD